MSVTPAALLPTFPDVRSRAVILDHIRHTMAFYHPHCIDPAGGFFQCFKDNGRIYDTATRHLVGSTRFIFNYAMAYRQFGDPEYQAAVRHGVTFLRDHHRQPETSGYAWILNFKDGQARVLDGTNHCYGLAFVLLAYSHALMAGIEEARNYITETVDLMEKRFYEPAHALYADEAEADWSVIRPYRGQNANMHTCEAMLAAFEATGERRYLLRAESLAHAITVRQAGLAGDMVWEHYHSDWSVDWEYNKDDKTNIFRPWGYQPGHLTEWAKLLLIMERHAAHLSGPADWLLPKARFLFDTALAKSWDSGNGGMVYGFGPDGSVCDSDKYFWVQAESLAAAALLADRTGEAAYWAHYDALWRYSWAHFIDHRYGAWYRILRADNSAYDDNKSPAGKTDYHTMGACYEALNALR